MRRTPQRVLRLRWSVLLVAFILLLLLAQIARADGGVVIFQRASPPFTVTLFSAEMPLRPGVADLGVMLEGTEGHSPILDGEVFIELEHEGGTIIRAEATRTQARNKLLYCSLINLPAAGHWKLKLHVTHDNDSADIVSDVVVAAPQPVLLSYWKLFAAPLVIITLFVLNRGLRRSS